LNKLFEYRRQLLTRLVAATEEFSKACISVREPGTPLETGGWNVHQLAVHGRDVAAHVYGLRARRTVEEDNPVFQNFDGEAWMVEHYNPSEPIAQVLEGFTRSIMETAEWLESLPQEAWSRLSRHAVYGDEFTMQTWIERSLAHIEEHLETVKKAST